MDLRQLQQEYLDNLRKVTLKTTETLTVKEKKRFGII